MKGWAPAALSFVAMSPAAASPAKGPLDDARGRGQVEVLGGTLHPFYCQRTDVTTAEVEVEVVRSHRARVVVSAPLAAAARDGEVDAGWGNLGVEVHLRSVAADVDERWVRWLSWHGSAPTASDRGGAGFAARSAADVHAALDLGDFMPGTLSSRITGALRWQGRRWWVGGAVGHRVHVFMFDRGETTYTQRLIAVVGAGYTLGRWGAGATLDTLTDVLDARSSDGDRFRHLLRLGVERTFTRWRVEAALLVPVDVEARDEQSPMLALGVSRTVAE